MKKWSFLAVVFLWNIYMALAQEEDPAPKGQWKVNKEYDENGNLIAYDSVYVWTYDLKNLEFPKMDSLMIETRSYFENFELPEFDFSGLDSLHQSMGGLFDNLHLPDFNYKNRNSDNVHTQKIKDLENRLQKLKTEMDSLKSDLKKQMKKQEEKQTDKEKS